MVNSPSRPNSRPPAPVECGGMTPLWNWETCLPVDRAAMSARGGDGPVPTFLSIGHVPIRQDQAKNPAIKPNQTTTPFRVFRGYPTPISEIRDPSKWPSARTKAKNPCNRASSRHIKANQGIRRKKPRPLELSHSLEVGIWNFLTRPLCDFATPRLCVKNPASRRYQGSIKAKTPAIKANRA